MRGKPGGVGLGLLVVLQEGDDYFGGLLEAGKVNDILALETLLDVAQKFLHDGVVHVGEGIDDVGVEIFLCPLLRALHKLRQVEGIAGALGEH